MQQTQEYKPKYFGGVETLQKEFPVYTLATFRRKVAENEVPHFKKGGKVYFDREIIEAWLNKDRVLTPQEQVAENSEALSKSVTRSVKRRRK